MTLVLFDLDDTLLGNEMNAFIPVYLQALAQRMSGVADPSKLIKALMLATGQMIENTNPAITLEQKFDAVFYPTLGLVRQEVQGIIDAFYAQDFPKLQTLTQFRPEAVNVVEQVINRGDQVAIATNPLFPRTAILQRLTWAGFPPAQVPFLMIPSYETFHFAKPNPSFFAEFLAQLGWPKTPVIMVGNDVDSDMGAARQLGIPVFWMTNHDQPSWSGQGEIPPHGGLTDLIPWMESQTQEPLQMNFASPTALLAILRSTPAALATISTWQNVNLERRPALTEWSPGEVLCHLRDVDIEVNLIRLQKVINERNPFIPGQETDQWADERRYCDQDGAQALADFTNARIELLSLLEKLPDETWNRKARHAIFGPTNLRELVNIIAGHDIIHIQQFIKALESQY